MTLARERLYLVADGVPDGPLRAAVERGDVRTWTAAALLGIGEAPPDDPVFTEVSELLRADVRDGQVSPADGAAAGVVVDEQTVLLRAGEKVVVMSGPAFAGRLRAELHAGSAAEPEVGIPEPRHEPAAAPAVT